MGNAYFRFKQFTIHQANAAMKVSTDSCVFGAWLASLSVAPRRVLDIGTGTGLLAAMLAQVWDARFTAIEIDPSAALEARQNLQETPWHQRLQVVEGDVRSTALPGPFDCIVSNPPFYEKDLKSRHERINLARHSHSLELAELLDKVVDTLAEPGIFAILMPFHRAAEVVEKAGERGLYLHMQLNCRQTPGHAFFRACMLFRNHIGPATVTNSISILDEKGAYTPEAASLLRPYYLYL